MKKRIKTICSICFGYLLLCIPIKDFGQRPDLIITDNGIYYPAGETSIKPGMVLPSVFVVYKNKGRALTTADPKPREFKIQLYLSTNVSSSFGIKTVPVPYNYRDEMELKTTAGNPAEKSTRDGLFDNASHTITLTNVKLPDNFGELCKTGSVVLGAVIDVDNVIAEADEGNNFLCPRSYPVQCFINPRSPGNPNIPGNPNTPGNLNGKPDLIIDAITTSVTRITPGLTVGYIKVKVRNAGMAKAIGTNENPATGYMVDVILSGDNSATVSMKTLPSPYNFVEDMLIRGGRISNTYSLNPGEVKEYVLSDILMPGVMTPVCLTKVVYIGAIADSGLKVSESNESNNTKFLHLGAGCQ